MSQLPTSVDAAARAVTRRLDATLPRHAVLLAAGDADQVAPHLAGAPRRVVALTPPRGPRPAPSPPAAADVEVLAHAGAWAERGFEVDVVSASPDVVIAWTTSRGPDQVRVRGIRLEEADRVGHLTLEAYDRLGTFDGPYREFLADPLQRLDTTSALLVAEYEGEVVGTVTYVEPGDTAWEGPEPPHGDCGFRVLAVAPDAQGRGVGPRLVAACRLRATEAGRHRMFISSMTWMTRAHRMYERAGFVRRPDLDVMFPAGPGVTFTLDLTAEAPERFPPPGPVSTQLPWYADVWAH